MTLRTIALLTAAIAPTAAEISLRAVVTITISQSQVLERQAFEARLGVSNGLESTAITNLSVALTIRDADGELVEVSSSSSSSGALFFVAMDPPAGLAGGSVRDDGAARGKGPTA